MFEIAADAHQSMLAHAYDGLPDEACGLLGGRPGSNRVDAFVPCRNVDASAKSYSIGADGFASAEAVFDPAGLEVVGVMHSHTHTDPFPSPTDIDAAQNPFLTGWHYVIVSLRDDVPMLRSWLLDDRTVVEESVVIVGR
ncbi:MAG TPA: M67 family metallopeptidase [Acidimicrobiales bacterium]